jgi:hypothetical protein
VHPDRGQCLTDFVEFEWFDNGDNKLHVQAFFPGISKVGKTVKESDNRPASPSTLRPTISGRLTEKQLRNCRFGRQTPVAAQASSAKTGAVGSGRPIPWVVRWFLRWQVSQIVPVERGAHTRA